LNQWSTTSRHS